MFSGSSGYAPILVIRAAMDLNMGTPEDILSAYKNRLTLDMINLLYRFLLDVMQYGVCLLWYQGLIRAAQIPC